VPVRWPRGWIIKLGRPVPILGARQNWHKGPWALLPAFLWSLVWEVSLGQAWHAAIGFAFEAEKYFKVHADDT